jgi:hypothetical protein
VVVKGELGPGLVDRVEVHVESSEGVSAATLRIVVEGHFTAVRANTINCLYVGFWMS